MKESIQEKKSFMRVKCPECEQESVIFVYAKTEVKCLNDSCKAILASPRGGKAEVFGEVLELLK